MPADGYSCDYKMVQMIDSFTMSEQAMQDTLIQFSVCMYIQNWQVYIAASHTVHQQMVSMASLGPITPIDTRFWNGEQYKACEITAGNH